MNTESGKIYVTTYKNYILTAVYEEGCLAEIYADKQGDAGILHRIYVGKVKHIVKNIDAAFVEIGGGIEGYYKISDNPAPVFLNHKKNGRLACGDEILVQVEKEAVKTKNPVVTSCIVLPGRYAVLRGGKADAGVSTKIHDTDEKQRLRLLAERGGGENFGFIMRTEAAGVSDEEICSELSELKARYECLVQKSRYMTCFSEVYHSPEEYIARIETLAGGKDTAVTTDIREVYEKIKDHYPWFQERLHLYEDIQYPLIKLLSLETQIERLLSPRVWLRSGGSLVIEQTEAFVVIDVNTGRYMGKKTGEESYFKINMEAAKEIPRQLRLRNLSGIILIDFINMKDARKRRELIDALKEVLAKDRVKTVFVDMTALDIAELTRKKERRPLHEQLGRRCPVCRGTGFVFSSEERQ